MTISDYQRHKDRLPEQTIAYILGIIRDLDLEIEEEFFDFGVPNCFSERVTIKGSNVGANGKGATPVLSRASALAELMERLQNGLFTSIPIQALKDKQADYYSVRSGRIIRRPLAEVIAVYSSNGMCAGNTPQEALTQGLAEILERHCHCTLLQGEVCPPEISDSSLQAVPSLYQTISAIRAGGRFLPRVFDLSLGEGWPVLMTMIHDQQTGRFGCRLACHPSFAVALERTLTEAMQGHSLEHFAEGSWADSLDKVQTPANFSGLISTGNGCYPAAMLLGEVSYAPLVYEDCRELDNYQLLRRLAAPLLDRGYDILIRDVGFLGLPSYHVLIPGFSDLAAQEAIPKVSAILQTFADLIRPSLEKSRVQIFDFSRVDDSLLDPLIGQLQTLAGNKGATPMSAFYKRQFTGDFPGEPFGSIYMRIMIRLYQGRDEEAHTLIKALRPRLSSPEYKQHIEMFSEYLRLKALPLSPGEAASWLRRDFGAAAEPILDLLADRPALLDKVYPRLNCGAGGNWDCAGCGGRHFCRQPEIEALARTLNEKEAAYKPDYATLTALFAK